jgi:hypothetical protein
MDKYTVKILVTYTVLADSEAEAREAVIANEYPFFPHDEGWYESEEITSVVLKED